MTRVRSGPIIGRMDPYDAHTNPDPLLDPLGAFAKMMTDEAVAALEDTLERDKSVDELLASIEERTYYREAYGQKDEWRLQLTPGCRLVVTFSHPTDKAAVKRWATAFVEASEAEAAQPSRRAMTEPAYVCNNTYRKPGEPGWQMTFPLRDGTTITVLHWDRDTAIHFATFVWRRVVAKRKTRRVPPVPVLHGSLASILPRETGGW